MIVDNYISNHIIPLKLDDNFSLSVRLMDESKLSYFPVLNGNTYCGLISDLDVYELESLGLKIMDRREFLKDLYIYNNQTIFEATSIILDNSLDVLPVVDKNKNYLGVLTINKLLEAYSTYTAADQQGDVIQIVLNYNDLYISEISRIIENEDARIINLFLVPVSESTQVRLIIKLNKMGLCRVVKALERYNYKVEYFYQYMAEENLSDNYGLLMKYLRM